MSEVHDRRAALRKWGWDVSANAMGGLLTAFGIAAMAAMVFVFKPVQAWLVGEVHLMGWLLLAMLLTAFFGGLAVARRRYRTVPVAAIPSGPARVKFVVPPFEPSEFEIEMIRALRFADGAWMSATRLMELVKADSRQDVEQSMARLTAAGWAADSLGTPMRYKLAGLGIDYARAAGFPTITGAERELGSANETPAARAVSPVVSRPETPTEFHPGLMQAAVIRAMRAADGWISVGGLTQQLSASQQDIRSVLRGLEAREWVEGQRDNILKRDGAHLFRLDELGLTYARERGFQTAAEIERDGANQS